MLVYNSPANDPSLGTLVGVPVANYGPHSVMTWRTAQPAIRGPGVIYIPRGAYGTLPSDNQTDYYMWILRGSPAEGSSGDSSAHLVTPVSLIDTYTLRFHMNDTNAQTVYTDFISGSSFFRAYLPTGQDVFVFGQVNSSPGFPSPDTVGVLGTYVYPPQGLRWTNVYNLPDESLNAPVPPGFTLETPGGGSSWMPEPKPVVIYNSPDNSSAFHTLVAVPATNYGSSVQLWEEASPGVRGPGVLHIRRGELVSLPTGSHIWDIWMVDEGGSHGDSHGGSHLPTAIPLGDTFFLRQSMNDFNQQTSVVQNDTGAVFYRTFTPSGGEVFVFGRFQGGTSASGIADLGTYVYPPLSLTWSNLHNRPIPGLHHAFPPGFIPAFGST